MTECVNCVDLFLWVIRKSQWSLKNEIFNFRKSQWSLKNEIYNFWKSRWSFKNEVFDLRKSQWSLKNEICNFLTSFWKSILSYSKIVWFLSHNTFFVQRYQEVSSFVGNANSARKFVSEKVMTDGAQSLLPLSSHVMTFYLLLFVIFNSKLQILDVKIDKLLLQSRFRMNHARCLFFTKTQSQSRRIQAQDVISVAISIWVPVFILCTSTR